MSGCVKEVPFGRDTFTAFFLMRFEIGRKVPVPVSQMLSPLRNCEADASAAVVGYRYTFVSPSFPFLVTDLFRGLKFFEINRKRYDRDNWKYSKFPRQRVFGRIEAR